MKLPLNFSNFFLFLTVDSLIRMVDLTLNICELRKEKYLKTRKF